MCHKNMCEGHRTTYESWLSPYAMCAQGLNSEHQAWWRVPLSLSHVTGLHRLYYPMKQFSLISS